LLYSNDYTVVILHVNCIRYHSCN